MKQKNDLTKEEQKTEQAIADLNPTFTRLSSKQVQDYVEQNSAHVAELIQELLRRCCPCCDCKICKWKDICTSEN